MVGASYVLGAVAALLSLDGVAAHLWTTGSCPSVAPFAALSMDKFLGKWYVIEQFDTSSTCLSMEYTRKSETSLQITKQRQISLLDQAGVDHINSYVGNLDIPFANNQGLLRVKWPLNIAGKADYVIFDTDYENYAGVYDCQQIIFLAHRHSAAILSRTPKLDAIYVDRVKRRLQSFKVDIDDFDAVSHAGCRNETDISIKLDEDTFKNVLSSGADTITDAAKKFAGGFQDIATSVVDGVKNIGNSEPIKEAAEVNFPSKDLTDVELLE